MGQPRSRDGAAGPRQRWRGFIIVLAICGLTVSLATRTFRAKVFQGVGISSNATQAIRQHLDRDAVRLVPPVPLFTKLQVPKFYPHVASAGPPLASVLFDKSLYNRPPPSC